MVAEWQQRNSQGTQQNGRRADAERKRNVRVTEAKKTCVTEAEREGVMTANCAMNFRELRIERSGTNRHVA